MRIADYRGIDRFPQENYQMRIAKISALSRKYGILGLISYDFFFYIVLN